MNSKIVICYEVAQRAVGFQLTTLFIVTLHIERNMGKRKHMHQSVNKQAPTVRATNLRM